MFAFQIVAFLLYNFGAMPEINTVYFIIGVLPAFGLFYLSYHGIQQYSIIQLNHESNLDLKNKKGLPNQNSSEKNVLTLQKLKVLFKEKEVFKNPELRIATVANELDIPTHDLSQAINEQFGKPFYDFVAMYRVEFLKNKLVDPNNNDFTILTLALDSGFNSKASMNRIFKAHANISPSEYQRAHFKNESIN